MTLRAVDRETAACEVLELFNVRQCSLTGIVYTIPSANTYM